MTDKDGDKAFLAWKGVQSEMGKFVGEFQWTGGTGKYTGLKGNNSYRGFAIGLTSQGYALWEGKWQTP